MRNNAKQKGQTFIIVVMVMLVALFIGITVSSRFVKSLRNLTASDNVSKAQGVAEAVIERLLVLPVATLEGYIDNNNCGTSCALTITDTTGQELTAAVTLSYVGNSTNSYPIAIEEEEAGEVLLAGYPTNRNINVCWNGDTSLAGYYIYSQSGAIKATPFAYNAVLTLYSGNHFSTAAANFGYQNCFAVSAAQTPLSIRLHSLYGRTDASIVPDAGYTVPIQGIQIVSLGKAGSSTKKITVIKSTSFAPAYFDYVIYQKSWTDSLSN